MIILHGILYYWTLGNKIPDFRMPKEEINLRSKNYPDPHIDKIDAGKSKDELILQGVPN